MLADKENKDLVRT